MMSYPKKIRASFKPFGRSSSLRAVGLFGMVGVFCGWLTSAAAVSDDERSLFSCCTGLGLDIVGEAMRNRQREEKPNSTREILNTA
jgi:hypothetical protein